MLIYNLFQKFCRSFLFVFCASFQSVSEFRSFGVVRFVFDCSCVQLTSFRISVVHVFNLFQNSCRFVCLLSWFQPVSELPSFFVCCLLLHKHKFLFPLCTCCSFCKSHRWSAPRNYYVLIIFLTIKGEHFCCWGQLGKANFWVSQLGSVRISEFYIFWSPIFA